MSNSRISVVIPTCKFSPFLWDAIDSTLASARHSTVREILVIPNAGEENEGIARAIEERYHNTTLRVVIRETSEVLPVFANWNDSISYASADFIHLFHDDDLVDQDFYATANNLIASYPDSALVYLPARFFGSVVGEMGIPFPDEVWKDASLHLATRNPFLCPGVLFRKSLHQGFDPKFNYTSDWRSWYQLSTQGKVIVHNKYSCSYRVHSLNGSSLLVATGTNVREALITARDLSSHYMGMTGIRPKEIGNFAASLGYTESINAAKRRDIGTMFLQLRLAVAARFSIYSLARILKRILQALVSGR